MPENDPKPTEEPMKAYRDSLLSLKEKMEAQYDKAVLTLSGGAIGISITFTKELIGKDHLNAPNWLVTAWLCWSASLAAILWSFYTSAKAMETAILQTDQHALYRERRGGIFDWLTRYLNAIAGALFIFGLVSITVFVRLNLK
jgi:hypothetical protein